MESNITSQQVLAFDFGMKRIGCAVGQSLTRTASPAGIIQAKQGRPHQWDDVEKLLQEWRPSLVVVGYPLNIDDTENPVSEAAKRFAKEVEKRFKKPVVMHDERLSTRAAKDLLAQRGHTQSQKKKGKNERVDAVAACLILESYLNTSTT